MKMCGAGDPALLMVEVDMTPRNLHVILMCYHAKYGGSACHNVTHYRIIDWNLFGGTASQRSWDPKCRPNTELSEKFHMNPSTTLSCAQ